MVEARERFASGLDEVETRLLAIDLGVALPCFRLHDDSGALAGWRELFRGWADRVALAAAERERGRLTPADLDECDRHLGIAGSRTGARP